MRLNDVPGLAQTAASISSNIKPADINICGCRGGPVFYDHSWLANDGSRKTRAWANAKAESKNVS
jgi:hypothetical protein